MRSTTIPRLAALAAAVALAAAAGAADAADAAAELEPFDARTPAALRAAHAGKPFVLVFWSTTCGPCVEELPHWAELARRNPGIAIHLVLLPISEGDEEADAQRMLERVGATGVHTAVAREEVIERVFHAVDPAWRGELPAAWFFDAAHRSERRLGRVEASWVEAWMKGASRPQ